MTSKQIITLAQTVNDQTTQDNLFYIAHQVRNNFINEMEAGIQVLKLKKYM